MPPPEEYPFTSRRRQSQRRPAEDRGSRGSAWYPCSWLSENSRSAILSPVLRSRLPVGFIGKQGLPGRPLKARASIRAVARRRKSCGRWSRRLPRPSCSSSAFAWAPAFIGCFSPAQQRREFDVFQRVPGWDQHKGLKDKTNVTRTQRGPRLFIKSWCSGCPTKMDLAAAAVVRPAKIASSVDFTGAGFANQRDGFSAFDNEFNSSKDGSSCSPMTDFLRR